MRGQVQHYLSEIPRQQCCDMLPAKHCSRLHTFPWIWLRLTDPRCSNWAHSGTGLISSAASTGNASPWITTVENRARTRAAHVQAQGWTAPPRLANQLAARLPSHSEDARFRAAPYDCCSAPSDARHSQVCVTLPVRLWLAAERDLHSSHCRRITAIIQGCIPLPGANCLHILRC